MRRISELDESMNIQQMGKMALPIISRRSSGIPVSPKTYKQIAAGNAARDRREWARAADAYRRALSLDPQLAHIWIQLGHAEKELDRFSVAAEAYRKAGALQPNDAEPLIHLGHLQNLAGDLEGAAAYYLKAARRDVGSEDAARQLQELLARILPSYRADLREMLRHGLLAEIGAPSVGLEDTASSLLLDVTNLVDPILIGKTFTANEQSELELIGKVQALSQSAVLCAHIDGHADWISITGAQFTRIRRIGQSDSNIPEDMRAKRALELELEFIFAAPVAMAPDMRLLHLSKIARSGNQRLFVEAARTAGVLYVSRDELEKDYADLILSSDDPEDIVRIVGSLENSEPVSSPRSMAPLATGLGFGSNQAGLDYRVGTGWLEPQLWGSWTHPRGAELALPVDNADALRLNLLLRGLPASSSRYMLSAPDGTTWEGEIPADGRKWIAIDNPPMQDNLVRLFLKGGGTGRAETKLKERPIIICVGVIGLHLCKQSDLEARRRLLEASTLGVPLWT